jgi:imidazole glycerol phosphate synthase glutamine amidotransferase subunit
VVLPGVGAFAAGIGSLRARELDRALADRVRGGAPTLAVCLGLQLLALESDEAPGERGLGLLEVPVRRFPPAVSCPQLGWNAIRADEDCALLESGWVAFANSFRLTERPAGWACATADHGGEFVAAVERGAVLGCQFHPELSGALGARVLARWCERAGLEPTADARAAGGVA